MSTILGSLKSSTDFSDIAEVIAMTNNNSTNASNIATLNDDVESLASRLTAAETSIDGVISGSADRVSDLKTSTGNTTAASPTTLKQIPAAMASVNSTLATTISDTSA